jgi:hypothetical protein
MSETKFTPGPWECKQVKTSSGRAFRIGKDAMLEPGPKGCCIIYDDYGHGTNERSANAALIAAAPEMYAALEKCIEHMRCIRLGYSSISPEEIARAALLKARGGAL